MAAPTISSFTPTSAGSRSLVAITGTNFTGATAVSFGGKAALSFIVVSALYIAAEVNTGSSGSISVTTPDGVATLTGFTYTGDGCGCDNIPDSCIPQALVPTCDDPEYCDEIFTDKCIVHKGSTLTNLSAPDGTRLDVILGTINTKISYSPLIQVATYAAMITIGVQATAVIYKVLSDENKTLANTIYIWWPDNVRVYITTTLDS